MRIRFQHKDTSTEQTMSTSTGNTVVWLAYRRLVP